MWSMKIPLIWPMLWNSWSRPAASLVLELLWSFSTILTNFTESQLKVNRTPVLKIINGLTPTQIV